MSLPCRIGIFYVLVREFNPSLCDGVTLLALTSEKSCLRVAGAKICLVNSRVQLDFVRAGKKIGYIFAMIFDHGAKQIIRTLIQGAVSHKHVCNRTRTTNCKIDGAQQ